MPIALLAILALALGGCASGFGKDKTLQVRSLSDEPRLLTGEYVTAIYAHDGERGTSIIVSDLTPTQLIDGDFERGQVIHMELLWQPKAGATPMDRTATNTSIRHVVFVDGEVGVYGGAGFVIPSRKPGKGKVRLDIRQASLTLLESTENFIDPLGPSEVLGRTTVEWDEARTRSVYFHVSQQVTNMLGKSRFVWLEGEGTKARRHEGTKGAVSAAD